MIQHYFTSAWIPSRNETDHFYGKKIGDQKYAIGSYTPAVVVEPGQTRAFTGVLYAGPKLQDAMSGAAEGLELTVDYGWLTVIAQPMFMILSWIHKVVGNWGWTIIIFTILIKLAFYKLSETSYRSMANMRKLTPRIQALRDRYGDDRQRLNQAMMEIYQKEKINPLGGCLPIVIQIPFFIALYWVLLESVELRQAPWILWINDLVRERPLLHPAAADGCHHGGAAEALAGAPGPHTGEGDDAPADRLHRFLRVLPGRPGPLLVRQQPAVDRTTVAHHAPHRGRCQVSR